MTKMMGLLAMKTDQLRNDMIDSDLREIGIAARKLADHAFLLGGGLGFGTSFLGFLACAAAMGEIGLWIAFIAVVVRLFFPHRFPDWLELPGALILLLVVAPGFFAQTVRGNIIGAAICLIIACYLLQEHIRASGGFRNSFTQSKGVSNSIGIILLMVYPVWCAVMFIL